MWDVTKQRRYDELQQYQQERELTAPEQTELKCLVAEIEQDEWQTIEPLLARLNREQEQLRAEYVRVRTTNQTLAALLKRQEALLARARAQVNELLAEHEALRIEYQQVTEQELVAAHI